MTATFEDTDINEAIHNENRFMLQDGGQTIQYHFIHKQLELALIYFHNFILSSIINY